MGSLRNLAFGLVGAVAISHGALAAEGGGWGPANAVRDWIARTIEGAVSGPDMQVSIGTISGAVPLNFTIADVSVADTQGVWLRMEEVHVNLAPTALFRARAKADVVEAARVTVERAPVSTAPEPEPADPNEPFDPLSLLPDLPVGLAVDRLAVQELRLGAPLLGEPATLRLTGSLDLARGGNRLSVDLDVARIDDKPGQAKLNVAFDPGEERLQLALDASEPAGGVMARALSIPGLPPVTVNLQGAGPLGDWKGRLEASAENTARLTADAAVQAMEEGHAVTLMAGGDVAALLSGPAVELVGEQPALNATVVVRPDRSLLLRPVTVRAAAGDASLEGSVGADYRSFDLRYEVTAGAESALRQLMPGIGWNQTRLAGTVAGNLSDLSVALNGIVRDLSTETPGLAELAGPEVRLDGRAQVNVDRGDVRLEGLTLSTAAANASLEGTAGGWGQSLDMRARVQADDLSRLSALAGQPLAGAAVLEGPVTRAPDGAMAAALTGSLRGLNTGTPADAVLGETATLAARLAMEADGTVRVSDLTVDGRNGGLTGRATLAGGTLDAATRLSVNRLEPVGDSLAVPMEGTVTLDATARGPMDALRAEARLDARDLVVQGRRFGETSVTATATGLPASPNGTVRARTALAGASLSVDGAYALEGQVLRLSDLAVANGPNRVTGALQVALDSMTATGRLNGSLPQLNALSELAGVPLAGAAGFTADLDGNGGRQSATLTANADGLRVEGEAGPLLAARRLTARAEVKDALGQASGNARVELRDGAVSGQDLASVTASVDGSLAKAAFRADVAGAGEAPLALNLAGDFASEGALSRVRLERLQGRYQGESFRMTAPATVRVGERHYEVSDLRIASGNARLAADLGLTDGKLRGEFRLDQVPLALARLADPTLRLDGMLNARATLGGTVQAPRADATLRVANLRAEQTARGGVPGVDATLEAQWRDRRVSLNGDIATRGGAARMTLAAAAPLVLDPNTLVPSVPPNGALSASANGSVDISLANDLLAASGDRARGIVRLDVRASGTVGSPVLGGTVLLENGRYENRASGAVVRDINARLVGDGEVFTIQSFSGRTANGGRLAASGVIRPAAEPERQIDIRLTAENARLVNIDLAQADIGADLTVTGSFINPRLAGPVRILRAEIQIPGSLPPNVVTLDVREIGRGGSRTETAQAPEDAARQPFAMILDLTVQAPNQIYIRGRGLDAEFRADLAVGGTSAQPVVTGQVAILQGALNLLGETFNFERGLIEFDGGTDINPRLDFLAEATANGVTAQVLVTGTTQQPKLELTSPQGLPQDEVLAQVLFGKSVGDLTALEAVQLAQSAASLAGFGGGGGGILENVRRGLGVDRLDFSGANGGSVQAGRYVSDRVYVGVEQGLAGESRATVEVDITDNIKAEADVGANSDTSFGLRFEWDY
ncbi:translocation/assembly module TamB domain-containing protein [Azospirillum sp. SYSU D00513]|uniref:translocation/assembly module TamB domain-containing protein n=1 Tax=Azospirillum sp. SYSU D00513 TaxID=2812561 RepID=UPI001A968A24|nr:translocation/assembly module TamB domain-containing protein [Azospirillum sp. SYSU D00513]